MDNSISSSSASLNTRSIELGDTGVSDSTHETGMVEAVKQTEQIKLQNTLQNVEQTFADVQRFIYHI